MLAGAGYKGYYSFEWEKKWHPDIEEPEIAIPQYAKVMREYLRERRESNAFVAGVNAHVRHAQFARTPHSLAPFDARRTVNG